MTPALYGERLAGCGCRGVPDGQHLPGCPHHRACRVPTCAACGYRAATEEGCCGICGTPREGRVESPGGPVRRRRDSAAEAP
jgi:hypothetical protein